VTSFDVIIRCGAHHARLLDTVASVREQSPAATTVVVVTETVTPVAALPWIDATADRFRLRHLHVEDVLKGGAMAAAAKLGSSDAVLWLEAGERLARHALGSLADVFESEPAADVVTTSWLLVGPGERSRVLPPAPCGRLEALSAPAGGDGLTVARRSALTQLGFPDPRAGDLWAWELRLRALLAGRRVRATHEPMVVRYQRLDAPYARQWSDPERDSWIAHVLERFAPAFAADPASAIYQHEAAYRALAGEHEACAARVRDVLAQMERLDRQSGGTETSPSPQLARSRRLSPTTRDWGYSRGTPIDRHYIEQFLARHSADIRGRVLEVRDDSYATRFGGDAVTRTDVIDIDATNEHATIIADLRCAATIPDGTYDCVILTQTAQLVDDMAAVIAECARVLRHGGVLLATFPALSQVCIEYGTGGDMWRMTPAGARRLCEAAFHPADLEVSSAGNVLTSTAFLHGLACHELEPRELSTDDPHFPLVTAVRAVRWHTAVARSSPSRVTVHRVPTRLSHAVLLYHRVARPDPDVHRLAVPRERFAEHIAFLRARAEVLPLDTFVTAWLSGALPAGAVAITFDDGYRDVLESAAPVLVQAGLPATCFLTTDQPDAPYEYWWDVLEGALLADGPSLPARLQMTLPSEGCISLATVTTAQRTDAYWRIYEGLISLPAEQRDAAVAAVRRWAGRRPASAWRMTASEMREWASKPGLSVGAHSVRHVYLPRQSAEVQETEVLESRRTLETLLERPITSFAYPHGAVSDESVGAVRMAGFQYALTCDQPAAARRAPDRWMLPRVEVTPEVNVRFEDLMPSR
jgi:peptidoglycan/xylan/chitin deacetylase (PgdA/CDA1 family)